MSPWLLIAAAVGAPTVMDVRPGDTVAIECRAGVTTPLLLPEPGALNVAPGGAERLGIKVESLREGRLSVTPPDHPRRTRLSFRGRGGSLTLDVSTTRKAAPSEIRLRWAPPEAPRPTAVPRPTSAPTLAPTARTATPTPPAPTPTPIPPPTATRVPPTPVPTLIPTAAPTPIPTSVPTAIPTVAPARATATVPPRATDADELDLKEYALAGRPIKLNEVKGVPGQKRMVLEDAQEGPVHVWFRFRLESGADLSVQKVEGPNGPISAFMTQVEGKDLKIVAQLTKKLWKEKGGMRITLSNGLAYKFRLRNAGLRRVLGDAGDAVNIFD